MSDDEGTIYAGRLLEDAIIDTDMTLGKRYSADIVVEEEYHYATEQTTTVHRLKRLLGPIAP